MTIRAADIALKNFFSDAPKRAPTATGTRHGEELFLRVPVVEFKNDRVALTAINAVMRQQIF